MDAVEFLKGLDRMCGYYKGKCVDCPARDAHCMLKGLYTNDGGKVVPIIEQWAKEHPIKTRQSVFLEQYPGIVLDAFGVVQLCPMYISATHRDSDGECKNPERLCIDCRREFWMQEVK